MIAFQHKLPVGVQGTGVSSPIYGLYKYVLLRERLLLLSNRV